MSLDDNQTSIDELLDRAVHACNRGDRAAANSLAAQVLAVDHGNTDAEDLLPDELQPLSHFHDVIIARLLIAAGQLHTARERLDMSLQHAKETGMHFQDAELMRLRAHTFTEHQPRRTALVESLEVARTQHAPLYELRCALDSFDLLGDGDRSLLAGVAERFRGDARWPEYARAERILS
ncbi:hypothetical protein VST63_01000 [Mycolicibacterium sp. 050232]|uniref:hypothetical protein n=1 Tax=Mycolicibacterium sp. 050232 TaxID=3113982 RepID=UPI002E2A7573|nr:hypothetical protein [Mycolicibacterium sp. 050232]MED5810922.1 hypothetical protein [Mycolicibacterium sp. 050232]